MGLQSAKGLKRKANRPGLVQDMHVQRTLARRLAHFRTVEIR